MCSRDLLKHLGRSLFARCASQFIKEFPEGYSTEAFAGGLQLSGGQKQVIFLSYSKTARDGNMVNPCFANLVNPCFAGSRLVWEYAIIFYFFMIFIVLILAFDYCLSLARRTGGVPCHE